MKADQTPLEWISEEWAKSLAFAITAFGGPQAITEFTGEAISTAPDDTTWWQQEVSLVAGPSIWIGFPEAIWKETGGRCLESLGVTSPGEAEIRDTFREIVVQSLGGLMSAFAESGNTEVTCQEGQFLTGSPDASPQMAAVSLRLGGGPPMEIYFYANADLLDACQKSADESARQFPSRTKPGEVPAAGGRDKERVSSVVYLNMPVSISFGQVYLTLEEALSLTRGCIIPLNRAASAPGELKVNRRTVARGPIVESDGYYGITIDALCVRGDTAAKGRPLSRPAI